MTKNKSIFFKRYFDKCIQRQIDCDHNSSVGAAKRPDLNLFERQERPLEILQNALEEGEKSGPSFAFDVEDFLKAKRSSFNKRCAIVMFVQFME